MCLHTKASSWYNSVHDRVDRQLPHSESLRGMLYGTFLVYVNLGCLSGRFLHYLPRGHCMQKRSVEVCVKRTNRSRRASRE